MKKILILSILIFSFSIGLGQYRTAGQSTVGLSLGFSPASKGSSLSAKASYGKVIGDNYWLGKVELFYNTYGVSYSKDLDFNVKYSKYGGAILAGYSIENAEPVFFNIWAGIYAGTESIKSIDNETGEQSEKDLYGIPVPEEIGNAIAGLTGGLELEVMLTRKVSASLEYTQFVDFISNYSRTNYNVSGGLKIYFN